MNFQGNFRPIGDADVGEIAERASSLPSNAWLADLATGRVSTGDTPLSFVPLVYDPDLRHSHPTRMPVLAEFELALRPVLKNVADFFETSESGSRLTKQFGLGYFIRALLERLAGGESAKAGVEHAFSDVHAHRVLVPLVTSQDVMTTVGTEQRHLDVGEIVELNNRRVHSMTNPSNVECIHLVLDFVLPGEQCCCGAKLHPGTVCSPTACRETDQLLTGCNCCPEA